MKHESTRCHHGALWSFFRWKLEVLGWDLSRWQIAAMALCVGFLTACASMGEPNATTDAGAEIPKAGDVSILSSSTQPKVSNKAKATLAGLKAQGRLCNTEAESEYGYTCVSVFYGTNRAPLLKSEKPSRRRAPKDPIIGEDAGRMYGALADSKCEPNSILYEQATRSDDVCHLGTLNIAIPASRQSGRIESVRPGASIRRSDAQKYFWTESHSPMCSMAMDDGKGTYDEYCNGEYLEDPGAVFQDVVRAVLSKSDNSKGHAFVFVHGFNVNFRDAAFRAGQLKYDMQFDGPVFFYSWPSNGQTGDYFADQVDGDLSVDGLVRFLNLVQKSLNCSEAKDEEACEPTKIHIIAHSMGARVTSQALARIAAEGEVTETSRTKDADLGEEKKFGELIFAAGDIDNALFQKWAGAAISNVDGITIYTSRHDGSVRLSTMFRKITLPLTAWGKEKRSRVGYVRKGENPFVLKLDVLSEEAGKKRAHTVDISDLARSTYFYVLNWKEWFVANHSNYASTFTVTDDILYVLCNTGEMNPEQRGVAKAHTYNVYGDDVTGDDKTTYWRMSKDVRKITRDGCKTEFQTSQSTAH